MRFFNDLPDMECLSGDTLPEFHISPQTGSFSGCCMELIVAREKTPATPVICKSCTWENAGFKVQLTSEDTSALKDGAYMLHFRLVDSNGNSHRKLAGKLFIRTAAKGDI